MRLLLSIIFVLYSVSLSGAATRVYVMRGLGDVMGLLSLRSMDRIGDQLRDRGAEVQVGSWTMWSFFASDAVRHSGDRIVFIGHSQGTMGASLAANYVVEHGGHPIMVGIDPLCVRTYVVGGVDATNFTSTPCGFSAGTIGGARNINVSSYGDNHLSIVMDQRITERVIALAIGGGGEPPPLETARVEPRIAPGTERLTNLLSVVLLEAALAPPTPRFAKVRATFDERFEASYVDD